jgi:hypothetical protein
VIVILLFGPFFFPEYPLTCAFGKIVYTSQVPFVSKINVRIFINNTLLQITYLFLYFCLRISEESIEDILIFNRYDLPGANIDLKIMLKQHLEEIIK